MGKRTRKLKRAAEPPTLPHDLPDNLWLIQWRHVAPLWRYFGVGKLIRHIWRGLFDGNWCYWEATAIVNRFARRCLIGASLGIAGAIGYVQGYQQTAPTDPSTPPARRLKLPPATLETALPVNRWRDERCELEPLQSPPVIWLASWRHEVRALSGMTDQTATRGAYAFDYGEPTRHRRR